MKNDLTKEDSPYAIEIVGLSKMYKLYNSPRSRLLEAIHPFRKKYHHEFWALNDINLKIKKGEILGIVGRNGSGKSTLLKLISGIIQPTKGEIKVNGRVAALLEVGSGMNPQMTGRENINFLGTLMGFEEAEMEAHEAEIIEFAEIGEHIDQPVRTYSSGMKSKLGFAISTAIKPEILILDEVLSVGDALFQRKAFARMESLIKDENTTVLFVSHSDQSIVRICNQAVWLEKGNKIYENNSKDVIEEYQKYIYSQDDTKKKLLENYKENSENNNNIPPKNPIEVLLNNNDLDHSAGTDYYPELISKSKKEYGDYNVKILDIKILNQKNNKVNILKFGETYKLVYQIESNENARDVMLGMRFKSLNGIDISIASYEIGEIRKSEVLNVEWSFKSITLPGDFYINIGVNGKIHEESVVLKRITDALVFKSIIANKGIEKISYSGLVGMEQVPVIKRMINESSN